jgi:hypothetical protein
MASTLLLGVFYRMNSITVQQNFSRGTECFYNTIPTQNCLKQVVIVVTCSHLPLIYTSGSLGDLEGRIGRNLFYQLSV